MNSIYITSRKKEKEYLENNFSNLYFINNNPSKLVLKKIINKIRKEEKEQVIIENYFPNIIWFIDKLNELNIIVKVVWTGGLATLNDELELNRFLKLVELLENSRIKSLGLTEDNLYLAYKHLKGVKHIKLTVFGNIKVPNKTNKLIGIFGNPYKWQCSYFNELSSIKLIDNGVAVLLNKSKIAKRFCNLFDINYLNMNKKLTMSTFNNVLKTISVASCVEFTNVDDLYVIDAYNHGVPVLLGNNTLFFKKTKLEKLVVVSSDDNISEIATKLEYLINHNKEVIEEYKNIKKSYDNLSKDLINKFINE